MLHQMIQIIGFYSSFLLLVLESLSNDQSMVLSPPVVQVSHMVRLQTTEIEIIDNLKI